MSVPLAAAPRGLWYLTRGLGAGTLVLLTLSVALGILNARRFNVRPQLPRFVVEGLHRNVSLLVVVFGGLHVLTSVLDTFAPINLTDAFIPFVSSYRPLWLGFGAIALDLVLAVAITSMLRVHLSARAWRAIHWAAYAAWPLTLVHSFGAGSDAKQAWMLVLAVACVVVVAAAIAWRALSGWPGHRGVRTAALGATVAGPVALAVWLPVGPLAPGWARRAGTPPAILASVGGRTSTAVAAPTLGPPFSARVSGSAQQTTTAEGSAQVSIRTTFSGGRMSVTITGTPSDGGGVSMTSSSVKLGPPGTPDLYSGRITALEGSRFTATVSSQSGRRMHVRVNLSIDPTGSVTGDLRAAA